MPEEIMILSLVAIVFGTSLTALILTGIYKLIMAKINQGNKDGSGDINPQFFKALGEFKKNTERRIANLEEVVSDIEEERYLVDDNEKSMPEIEIEEEEVRSSSKKEKDDDGNLRNMLNE
ncbi:hypothetical protein [Gracilimonas sp. BCB1]|uniref:hypothetical protein n=1 Tax=Gracilimonas sp. BCB1 TaxID=3152362 RepID=UPI0032D8D905